MVGRVFSTPYSSNVYLLLNEVYSTALVHCYSIATIKMICSSAYKHMCGIT